MLGVIVSHRKTGFAVNLLHLHRPKHVKQGPHHLCPHSGSLPPKWPILQLPISPDSSLQMSILFRMLFSIYLVGTTQESHLFCNFDEKEVAFPPVPREDPKGQAVQGSPEAAPAVESCSSPLASAALELVSPPPSPSRSRCSCGPITQPVLA